MAAEYVWETPEEMDQNLARYLECLYWGADFT